MSRLQEIQFEMEGGVMGVVLRLIGYALKWIAIGALIHVGWKFVR